MLNSAVLSLYCLPAARMSSIVFFAFSIIRKLLSPGSRERDKKRRSDENSHGSISHPVVIGVEPGGSGFRLIFFYLLLSASYPCLRDLSIMDRIVSH